MNRYCMIEGIILLTTIHYILATNGELTKHVMRTTTTDYMMFIDGEGVDEL